MNEMRRLMWQSILVFQHCVAFATAVCVLYTSVRDRSEVRLWQIFVMSLEKRIAVSLVRIAAGVPIVSVLLCGLLVLVFSVTLRGRCVGLSAVLLAVVCYCSVGYWNRDWFRRKRRRFYGLLVPACALLYVLPAIFASRGGPSDGTVRDCYLPGYQRTYRYAPWNVLPEMDQVHIGICAAAVRDPYMGLARARTMWSFMRPIYETLERDPEFQNLGSALGSAYREVLRLEFRSGHYYLFVPSTRDDERLPCLVFLHGLGGNNKAYLWVLSQLTQQLKCVVVAPTFGIGNWDQEDSGALVVEVVRDVLASHPIDPQRVFLLGYSNGAMGVTRAVIQDPALFRGLMYVSAVTEDQLFSTPAFSARMADRPISFLHGGQDERIPALIEGTATLLRQMGGDVQVEVYEDADHFLLLAQQAEVLRAIAEFMKRE